MINLNKHSLKVEKVIIITFFVFIATKALVYSKEADPRLLSTEYLFDRNVEVINDSSGSKLQLARCWDTLLYQGFDDYGEDEKKQKKDINRTNMFKREYPFTDDWKFTNYKNVLIAYISKEENIDNSYLMISGSDKKCDTAFEINSPYIPIETGKKYVLIFRYQINKRIICQCGFKEKFETGIIWFDANGKKLDETPFSLYNEDGACIDWNKKKIEVFPPERTVKAIIRFGFDTPDLGPGEFICFDDIRFATLSKRYESEGEFISRPLPIESGKLSFLPKADMPTGASIRFQLRFASNNNGVPGTWTPFTGPDGTTLSYYDLKGAPLRFSVTPAQRWLQYRAVLQTTRSDITPALYCVTINKPDGAALTDSGWSGPDTTPPEIVWRSPTRTEQPDVPIAFRLCDNIGGLGIKSVEAYLDGEKVELLQSKSKGTEYILKTTGTLKPTDRSRELSTWRIENYQNALTVERTPEVITVINKSKDDTYMDTAFKMCSPRIPVKENTKYVLSFYSRHNMDLMNLKYFGPFLSGIIWRDCNGMEIDNTYINFGEANKKWHYDVHTVISPSGAAFAEICFGWDFPDMKNGDLFAVKKGSFDGPQPDVTLVPNLHRIDVKASDLAGNHMQKTWYVLIKKLPTEHIVSMRDDGMTLLDGKPFFPIGIYNVKKNKINKYDLDFAFRELSEAGFNTAHTYVAKRDREFLEFYSSAARYGMKVFVMSSAGHSSTDIETIVNDIAAEANQPALLSWYLADDTAKHISSSELKSIHKMVKDIDPYHLTSQADVVGRYNGYVDSTDIFLPELYPIHSKDKNDIAEIIRDIENIKKEFKKVGQNKGIWAIVQDFAGWGCERFPTNEELRVMTYLSIIHGANGIVYYTYSSSGEGNNLGAHDNKFVWDNLKKVVGELAYLHDVLAERNTTEKCTSFIIKGAEKDGLGYPALNTLLKVYQGNHYLFAANSAQQPIRCQFKPAIGNISEVSAMFEDRTLPVKDGVFVDDFRAYDVHVYQW